MSSTLAASLHPRAKAVLDFWLGQGWEAAPPNDVRAAQKKLWWGSGPEVDAQIASQFGADCEALLANQYDGWVAQPLSALAAILIGDQLSRNAYRGSAKMYAADDKVLPWAKALMQSGAEQLTPIQHMWLCLPLMHSEKLEDQDACVAAISKLANDCESAGYTEVAELMREGTKFAEAHRDVVAKWGRFPHRNAILGRQSTPEEEAGLADGSIGRW